MTQLALPKGWRRLSLGNVADVQLGKMVSAKTREDGLIQRPYLRNENVRWWSVDESDVKLMGFKPGELDRYGVEHGDLLVCEGGEPGRCAVYRGPSGVLMYQKALHRVRPRPGTISAPLLQYWLRHLAESGALAPRIAQTTIQHLPLERFREVEVPVPPMDEQAVILEAIERHLSSVDAGVAALKRVQANLKRYRASVLKAACEGRLVPTEAELARRESRDYESASVLLQRILKERRRHWEASELAKLKAKGKSPTDDRWKAKYKEPEPADATKLPLLPEGWCWTTIDAIADLTIGFAFKSTGFVDEGIRLLRGENIEPGRLRWLDTRCWPTADSLAYENLLVEEGDVILAMDRPVVSAGLKLAQAKSSDIPCLLVQRVARLRLFDGDNRLLFMTMSEDRFIRHVVVGGQTGTQLPHVSGSRIANYPVALPPAAEQERVIGEVQRRLSTVEQAETTVNADLARAERLRQSILQAAFEGKLTPLCDADHPNAASASGSNAKRRATGAFVELADA